MGQFEIMRLMSCYCGNSFKITNYYNKVQCEFIENNKAVESFENN